MTDDYLDSLRTPYGSQTYLDSLRTPPESPTQEVESHTQIVENVSIPDVGDVSFLGFSEKIKIHVEGTSPRSDQDKEENEDIEVTELQADDEEKDEDSLESEEEEAKVPFESMASKDSFEYMETKEGQRFKELLIKGFGVMKRRRTAAFKSLAPQPRLLYSDPKATMLMLGKNKDTPAQKIPFSNLVAVPKGEKQVVLRNSAAEKDVILDLPSAKSQSQLVKFLNKTAGINECQELSLHP